MLKHVQARRKREGMDEETVPKSFFHVYSDNLFLFLLEIPPTLALPDSFHTQFFFFSVSSWVPLYFLILFFRSHYLLLTVHALVLHL